MNYVFMSVMICFLFLAISIAIKWVTCFITSEILSNTLCKSNFTKEMKKKTIICGFISDLLSVVILPLILIIQNLLEYDSFLKFDDITIYNCIFYIFYIAVYPDYSTIASDVDWYIYSVQPLLYLIILSALIGLLINYLFIFKKSNLSKMQKICSLGILAITTAPYYFMISLGPLVDPLAKI